jgi:hypothetical protein
MDAWRQAIIGTLPEADSTVTRDSTGPQTNAPADCYPRKLEKVKAIDTPDGKTAVKVYSCGEDDDGFWEAALEVAGVGAGAAALGALAGGSGAVPAGLGGSGGAAGGMILDRVIDEVKEK